MLQESVSRPHGKNLHLLSLTKSIEMLKSQKAKNIILGILLLVLFFELIRSSLRNGDFIGYLNAGNLTLNGQNLYSDYLNTWPPFFSVFSVPLALLDKLNGTLARGTWTVLTLLSLFWLMRITVRWVHGKRLLLPYKKGDESTIEFTNFLVLVPFLILFRFVLDNLTNLQINLILLWTSVLVIDWFIKGKHSWAGALLALSISLKVYPIFLLLYFVFKRELKLVSWTVLFFIIINTVPFVVYGYEQAIQYYAHWWNEIASPYASVQHKNQSFFSMLRSLLTNESPGFDIYINVMDLPIKTLKKVAYGVIIVGALYPMYLFRDKLKNKQDEFALIEYAFVLAAIPILSPLAWKAYFIFLWPAYLLIYHYLYHMKTGMKQQKITILKVLYFVSILLNVFSTELFTGPRFSDILESYSCITIGTMLVLLVLLVLYKVRRNDLTKEGNVTTYN